MASARQEHPDAAAPEGRRRVVIVGAGFAGLTAAKRLADAPVEITLIDRRNHHLFQPLLYQVATAALSPADIAWPIRSVLSRQKNVRVVLEDVEALDLEARAVLAGPHRFSYDYLILATGSRHSYFGHEEWAPYAPGLKRVVDAVEIRRRILLAFERAETCEDPDERRRLLTFVVIGGGPTGVEMAGAIAELARFALARDFREIDPRKARILLIEASDRLLPAFPADPSDYARRALEKLGVEVALGRKATVDGPRGVDLDGEYVPAATIIWAAGVSVPRVGRWLGVETDRSGRIRVEPDLTVPGRPEIFVVGDAAAATHEEGRPVPGLAPAAKQMGRHAAEVVRARALGRPPPGAFRYRHFGDLATIGRHSAVVAFGRFRLRGALAWWLWGVAHIYFLIGVRAPILVALQWLWSYSTFGRGARLITGVDAAGAGRRRAPVEESERLAQPAEEAPGASDGEAETRR